MEKKREKLLLTESDLLNKIIRLSKSLLIDFFIWSYINFISFKIIWQRIINDFRYFEVVENELLGSVVVGGGIALLLFFFNNCSLGKQFYKKDNQSIVVPAFKRTSTYIIIMLLLLTFVAGWIITEISFSEMFFSKGFEQAVRLFLELFSPDLTILQKVIPAAIETIYMALMATVFAIPPAFIISFMAAKNLMKGRLNRVFYFFLRLCMNITRSVEPLIWAIIFSVWVGIGPFAGMLALMIHSVVSLAKLYSEQIEEMKDGPIEAIKATGASNILVLWYGVVPQVLNSFISFTIYRWDINVRMATIIGMVGGGGIGNMLMQYQGLARWNEVGTVIAVIAIIVWIMDHLSAKIRERLKD
jgi:phosphonate transport system permease protein